MAKTLAVLVVFGVGAVVGWAQTLTAGTSLKVNGNDVAGETIVQHGNKVNPNNITENRDPGLAQAASINSDLVFYDDDGAGRKPEKLIVRIEPDAHLFKYLNGIGAKYSTKNPTFRVQIPEEN